ncbi:hypothetical protein MMC07_005640 [Pseudocyphellaria aurata]|nr:hypothetical protein [Pseudocyphellaria aurata]
MPKSQLLIANASPALADEKNTQWNFCPSVGAAYLFAILFALTTCGHVAQAIIHRKGYSWVIIVSALLQTMTYVFRIVSINNPTSSAPAIAWFILILIAPLWTNAYVYMVMGRMVYNFTTTATLAGIKAWRFTLYFVLLDIVAFLAQVAGAASAAGNDTPRDQVLRGVHIYMGGIGLQQAFILVFLFLAVKFHRGLLRETYTSRTRQALRLLSVLYVALLLITVRIIFRLVEYSDGIDSSIPNHEAYQYCFDSLPMLIALVLFNIYHPGRIMPGKESDFPSRKERKRLANRSLENGIALSAGEDPLKNGAQEPKDRE